MWIKQREAYDEGKDEINTKEKADIHLEDEKKGVGTEKKLKILNRENNKNESRYKNCEKKNIRV